MTSFELPAFSPEARPEFTDSASCTVWLQGLPLINVAPAHGRLLAQLEELNGYEMPAAERLKVAELLRDAVIFVQAEQAKKFVGRAVPLARAERQILGNVTALWDALAHAYLRCLAAPAGAGQAALACQRALWCAGQKMADHHKAYQEVPAKDWTLLHQLYAYAEEHDIADDEVSHPVHKGKVETHCMETYAQALLLDLTRPSEQMPRQVSLTARWLERWARKVTIGREAPGTTDNVICVDLSGDSGATRAPATGESIRYLAAEEVGKSVRKRVALLRKGETPVALGLGDDVQAAAAEALLVMLHRQWCEKRPAPAPSHRSVSGTAQVTAPLAAMHYFITGQSFRQPGDAREMTKRDHDEIATFGRIAGRHEEQYSTLQGFSLETWQIKDESVTDMRLERMDVSAIARYQLNQLVAVRPADGKSFMLGTLRSLSVTPGMQLRAGVRTLPGLPQAIAVRPTGINARAEKYAPALLLPAVPALDSPKSLVLPLGWFTPKRVIEVYENGSVNVTLTSLMERGADYDRVMFGPV